MLRTALRSVARPVAACACAATTTLARCEDDEEFDLVAVRRAIDRYRREQGSPWLARELSSDIAGEQGAVCIYRGAASALRLRDEAKGDVAAFVSAHEAAESRHLEYFRKLLEPGERTKLLPLWRAAGFALGFVPTFLLGPEALYATVESVEAFVVEHYSQQIDGLREVVANDEDTAELVRLLAHCCADELHHQQDARRRRLGLLPGGDEGGEQQQQRDDSAALVVWDRVVRAGSACAAEAARRV